MFACAFRFCSASASAAAAAAAVLLCCCCRRCCCCCLLLLRLLQMLLLLLLLLPLLLLHYCWSCSVFFFHSSLVKMLYRTQRLGTNILTIREKNVHCDSKMYICAAAVAPAVVLRRKNIHVPLLNDASQIDYCRY